MFWIFNSDIDVIYWPFKGTNTQWDFLKVNKNSPIEKLNNPKDWKLKLLISPYVTDSGFWNPENFCLCNQERIRNPTKDWNRSEIQVPLTKNQESSTWNPESWVWNPEYSSRNPESHLRLESEIQVPLTKKYGIQYLESGIHSVESRIQYCLQFPYMGRPNRINTIRVHSGFQDFFAATI